MRKQFAPDIAKVVDGTAADSDPAWRRISAALDAVAAQRDAYASGLYWHTDLEAAKAAARADGKPILSLRLLGTLDSELSCANSRFFRTALYANRDVSAHLRQHFVLHWKSVRPVPRVTIDMGDGRKIYRTVTGNSIHYILDADGRPVDALPGLYGPAAFVRMLKEAAGCELALRHLGAGERASALAQWHANRSRALAQQWAADLEATSTATGARLEGPAIPVVAAEQPLAVPARRATELALPKADAERTIVREVTPRPVAENEAQQPQAALPDAKAAAVLARGKVAVERPLVNAVVALTPREANPATPTAKTDDATWSRIAARYTNDAVLDASSRSLMRAKFPAKKAAEAASTKRLVEDPMIRVIANFERSIAEDTVRNEYLFHRQIHEWFAARAPETADTDALNSRVYAELFLTPDSDPWLGLVPADTYSGLEEDGMSEACLD
jgi:hypothetical protein